MSSKTNCECDRLIHPKPLEIDAGLPLLPRQIARFSEFRNAMLAALPRKPPLAFWRARGDEDLGVMLIEMWAYVCDVLAFYDEVLADESFLRTATLPASVRKLVNLVGYRPRPPVGARVKLAVKVDGRLPLLLPAGLAFRSSAFASEPPQVFELDADTKAHPLLNGWQLTPVPSTKIAAGSPSLLLSRANARVAEGDRLLILAGGTLIAGPFLATAVAPAAASDGGSYIQVGLDSNLAAEITVAGARLVRPAATTSLWSNPSDVTASAVAGGTAITLSGIVPQIGTGSFIVAAAPDAARAFKVVGVSQDTRVLVPERTLGTPPATVTIPAVRMPVTVLHLDAGWPSGSNWSDPKAITVEFSLRDAGTLVTPPKRTIGPGDPLGLQGPSEVPPDGTTPGNFLAADIDGAAVELKGGIDFAACRLNLASDSELGAALHDPVTIYANIAPATRGETVPYEFLGFGDGSTANQSFTLKKKPLTYLVAPTAADPASVRSTLTIRVRGIQWREVPSFFGVRKDDEVFIIRQNDDGGSTVMFGDGVRGARLPAGAEVAARYRFGAGSASPPSGSITQLAKPVKGISSVRNPVAAAGGADAEPALNIKTYAPRSALVFGRAVSLKDVEALVASQPGVTAVSADWSWDAAAQQPGVSIAYIGSASIAPDLRLSLRGAMVPATPIQARPATAVPANLVLDVRLDPRSPAATVCAAVRAALCAPGKGLLSPACIGIGRPLFRSAIVARALEVDGVRTLSSMQWNGATFEEFGKTPGSGKWFDVSVTISASGGQDG